MKRLLLLLLLAAAPAAGQVVLQFDYDTAKDTPCSATVTADCVKEFEIGIELSGSFQRIAVVSWNSCASSGANQVTCTTPPLPSLPGRKYKLNRYAAWAVSSEGTQSVNSNTVDVQTKPGNPKNLRAAA